MLYNNLNISAKNPGGWRKLKGMVEESSSAGIRAYPLTTPYKIPESDEDLEALREILNFPSAILGLSDGGAHVQMHGGYGYSTRLLGYWVREQGIMSLEHAVRRLTFESASAFGIYDRGLLRPGMAADVTIFDPDTVQTLPEERFDDFPAGGLAHRGDGGGNQDHHRQRTGALGGRQAFRRSAGTGSPEPAV